MNNKVQVGYGSGRREYGKRTNYGGRNSGKKVTNGGFGYCPTISFENITQERWDEIFGKKDAQTK